GYSLRENNFHVAREPGAGRFLFEPAGMDQLFGKADFNWKPDMTGRFARAVMAFPEGRDLYEKQFRKIFAAVFDVKTLRRAIENRVEEIRPVLDKSELTQLRAEATDLCNRISRRHNYLRNQI